MKVTLITSSRPATLSKRFALGLDDTLEKRGGGAVVDGRVEIREVGDLAGFRALLGTLGPNQALAFGLPVSSPARLMSREAFEVAGRPAGAITRTRDCFSWPTGPGIMMLDHDPSGDERLTRELLVSRLVNIAPGLSEAAMVWLPSASSHIHDTDRDRDRDRDRDLTGLRGQRIYIPVADASDIRRAGKALVDRLWAGGYGRIVPSQSGMALERCPVDATVWQPERLDFAAGAICTPPLEQRRGNPVLLEGVPFIDTREAPPDDARIRMAADAARRTARIEAADALAAARDAYVERRADQMLGPDDGKDEGHREAARAIMRRAVDHGVLGADFPVDVEVAPGRVEQVTVGRILNDREGFHGRLTRDPLEPGYDGGRTTGKLFLLDARPTLFSFAHRGHSFRLIRAPHRIEVVAGRMVEATEAALDLLRDDPAVFDLGGQVAVVEAGSILAVNEHALAHHLGGHVQFWRRKTLKDGSTTDVDIDPPARLVQQILSLGQRRRLKALSAIITAPTLRPDGSLLATPGYDTETGLLLDLQGRETPEIPTSPGGMAVEAALDRLMQPFRDFPLVDAHAAGGLLAALLTAVVRPGLPTAPAFAIDAPVQGSGKTLLASCMAALATGRRPEVWPHTAGRDDEEVRKRLFTALRDGSTAVVWDNVTGVLDSPALASAITAPVLRDRVLGRSESAAIPNRALLILTGNNICPAGDLPRRLIPVRIDPGTDRPFTRQFDVDPCAHVLEHRLQMVVAGLVLVRGWLASGNPRAAGRMASFETWDDLVRQTVVWVGMEVAPGAYGDPLALALVLRAQGEDPEQESLFALLEALAAALPNGWCTAKDVAQRAQRARAYGVSSEAEEALADAIVDIAGERALASTRSIGRMLRFRVGRVVYGRRLVSRSARNGHEYRVETVTERGAWGFGGFGGFDSGASETRRTGDGSREDAAEDGKPDPEPPETNPPNPPNLHPADAPFGRGRL